MKIARAWYLGAAVFGVAGVLAAGPLTAQVTVTIDADDIGGVVTGPNGPEAGVWVIAETTDLADQVRQDRRHRRSGPLRAARICRRPSTRSGCAAMAWSIRQGRQRARQDPQPDGEQAPNDAAAAEYYPALYWYSMLKVPAQERVPRHRTERQRHRPAMKSQGEFLDRRQDQRLRHLPPARQQGDAHDP